MRWVTCRSPSCGGSVGALSEVLNELSSRQRGPQASGGIGHMIELPRRDRCEFCEGMAGRDDSWAVVAESELCLTVVNPYQFEVGQCCVITRRHAATLLDITDVEGAAIIEAAREIALAMLAAYRPLGILTYQNNGVYSGQEVPHFHFHVVPRQKESDWGIGPPQ